MKKPGGSTFQPLDGNWKTASVAEAWWVRAEKYKMKFGAFKVRSLDFNLNMIESHSRVSEWHLMIYIFLKDYISGYSEEQKEKQGVQLGGCCIVAWTWVEVARMEEVNGFEMWIECGIIGCDGWRKVIWRLTPRFVAWVTGWMSGNSTSHIAEYTYTFQTLFHCPSVISETLLAASTKNAYRDSQSRTASFNNHLLVSTWNKEVTEQY